MGLYIPVNEVRVSTSASGGKVLLLEIPAYFEDWNVLSYVDVDPHSSYICILP